MLTTISPNIFIDVETIPPAMSDDDKRALVKVPGNYSKPESIGKYIEENYQAAWQSLATDTWHAGICSITYAIDDGAPVCLLLDSTKGERALMESFSDSLESAGVKRTLAPQFVTYFGNVFDLPLLWRRSVKYGFGYLAQLLPHKKFANHSIDLHDVFLATDYRGKTGGMDAVLKYFGLPTKTGDGSQVLGWWQDGNIDALRAYAIADVVALQNLYSKIETYI